MYNPKGKPNTAAQASKAQTKHSNETKNRSRAKGKTNAKACDPNSHNQQYLRNSTELLKSLLICHTDPDATPNSRISKTSIAKHAGIAVSTLYRHLPGGNLRQTLIQAEQTFLESFNAFVTSNLSEPADGDINSNWWVFNMTLNFILDNWDIFLLLAKDEPSEWVFNHMMDRIFPCLAFSVRPPRFPAIKPDTEETYLYLRTLSGVLLWWCGRCRHGKQVKQPGAETCVQEMMAVTSALMRGSFYLGV